VLWHFWTADHVNYLHLHRGHQPLANCILLGELHLRNRGPIELLQTAVLQRRVTIGPLLLRCRTKTRLDSCEQQPWGLNDPQERSVPHFHRIKFPNLPSTRSATQWVESLDVVVPTGRRVARLQTVFRASLTRTACQSRPPKCHSCAYVRRLGLALHAPKLLRLHRPCGGRSAQPASVPTHRSCFGRCE
jgi:hypothetical protein